MVPVLSLPNFLSFTDGSPVGDLKVHKADRKLLYSPSNNLRHK